MGRNQQKGAKFEQACADYLTEATNYTVIRQRTHGANDEGDLYGLRLSGYEITVECKDCKTMQLSQWIDEAQAEKANADAKYAVVIHHRKGRGSKSFGDNYVTMNLRTFVDIINDNY